MKLILVLLLTLSSCQETSTTEIVRRCGDSALYRTASGKLSLGPVPYDYRQLSPVAKDVDLKELCP